MADRIKGITIEIGGNTTELQTALKDVNKHLKDTQTELKDVNKLLKLDPKNVDLLKQKQKLLTDAIGDTKKKLDTLKTAQSQYAEGSKEWNAIEREIVDVTNELEKLEKQYKEFGSVAAQQIAATGKSMQDFGNSVTNVGQKLQPVSTAAAAVGAGLLALAYNSVTASDDLNTLAKQTGFTTEEIQQMQYAADRIDVSFEDIAGALKKLKPKISENNETLKSLGVSTKNVDGTLRDATDVFYDAVVALSHIENETERDQVAMELFGKSADSLSGIIDDGGAALRQYGKEAKDLGLIMSQDTLDSLNSINDAIDTIKAQMGAALAKLGATIAQVFLPALQKLTPIIEKIAERIAQITPQQAELILKIIGIVAVLGPLLTIGGKLISGIGTVLTFAPKIVTAVAAVGTAVKAASTAVAGFVAANAGMIAAVGGYVILFAAAAAAGALLAKAIYENWDDIVATVKKGVEAIKDFFVGLWTGITNVFNKIKTTITNGVNNIRNIVTTGFQIMRTNAVSAWNSVTSAVSSGISQMRSSLSYGFSAISSSLSGVFQRMYDSARNTFQSLINLVGELISRVRNMFSSANWSLPKIKLPHFKINWKDIGGIIKLPLVSVEWYRKAYENPYLFTEPTVVNGRGFGDGGGGGEIVYGRDQLMRDIAEAKGGDTININVYASDGMDVNQLANKVQQRLTQIQKQRMNAYA